MENILQTILTLVISLIIILVILIKPYFGIVLTVISLPVIMLLPETRNISSVVVLIGAMTIVSYIFSKGQLSNIGRIKFKSVHIVSLFFVIWLFVSNPEAALFGSSRNWVFTFFQCWILLWLTGELLNSPKKQQIFMWLFSIIAAISAVIAIGEGQIGDTISTSIRAYGLAGQPNATARYLVISMIFFSYLITVQKHRFWKVLATAGAIVTSIGVFFTLSRSGILLLFIAVGLIIAFNFRNKKMWPLVIIFLIVALYMWLYSGKIINILESIVPSIQQGTDTVGVRFSLWQAGWRMWLDHMISGVGVGNYPPLLRYYAIDLPSHYWNLTAHNTYIMILAETGIVGLVLFISMMVISLRNYAFFKTNEKNIKYLRNTWMIAFVIYSIGAGTMSAQYDKLLWFLMGASMYFQVTSLKKVVNVASNSSNQVVRMNHGRTTGEV